jgi:hypothetical protein
MSSPFDLLQPTVAAGNTYLVPAGGALITSWSTNAAAGSGQMLEMKVFRKVAEPSTYMVVAHDGPRALTSGTVNTFPVNVPVQPGDVLGANDANATSVPNACVFSAPGESHFERSGDLADGMSGDFPPADVETDFSVNVSAVVGLKPSNAFSFGKLKRNKRKGTATLAVNVPGPGTLSLTGKGVKTQRTGAGAVVSKAVAAAGTVRLRIAAKRGKKRKLENTGKVKVRFKVTYNPNGTSTGDLIGDPNTHSKRVKLIKKR